MGKTSPRIWAVPQIFEKVSLFFREDLDVAEPDLAAFGLEGEFAFNVRRIADPVHRLAVEQDENGIFMADDDHFVPFLAGFLGIFDVLDAVQFRTDFFTVDRARAIIVAFRRTDERVAVEAEKMPHVLRLELAFDARRKECRGGTVFPVGHAEEEAAVHVWIVGRIADLGREDEIAELQIFRSKPAERSAADFEDAVFELENVFLFDAAVEETFKIIERFAVQCPDCFGSLAFLCGDRVCEETERQYQRECRDERKERFFHGRTFLFKRMAGRKMKKEFRKMPFRGCLFPHFSDFSRIPVLCQRV